MHMHMKSGIYKCHDCSNDAKINFTRERAVKDNSIIFCSDLSLKDYKHYQKSIKLHQLQILAGFKNLRFVHFEMSQCFSDFEHLAAKLISLETRKKCLRLLYAMTTEKFLLRNGFPKCPSFFPASIGSYLKL